MACEHKYLLLLFSSLILLPFFSSAQTYNISLGSSLTARNDNPSWASPSGDFAFGFQKIGKDGFLLAIWFNKIPERTVVWSANGQNLAPKGSKVELTSDGWLLLNDPTGKRIWSASNGTSGNGIAYAAMLDTGNFVLVGQDSQYVWESFHLPTDTILPGQVLNQPARLVSRYLENNYSSGRFQFKLQQDGNLVLYTTSFPLDAVNFNYRSTQVLGSGFSLVFNKSGYIFLQRENRSIIDMISSDGSSTADLYQRAILEYDGVFRHYAYPKSKVSRAASLPYSWSVLSLTPSNMCRMHEDRGSGACGFNSYCTNDGGKSCHCPLGYSFIDPNDVMKGCKQDFVSQSCDEASPETDLFDLNEMLNTDWTYSDYGYFASVTETWCREACLADCFCAAVVFRGEECWKKKEPLSNGIKDFSFGGKALIKIRIDNSTLNSKGHKGKDDHSKLIIVGSVLLSSAVFLILALLVATFLVLRWLGKRKIKVNPSRHFKEAMNLRSFTYQELSIATDEFKEELGHGAFATVYKGALLGIDGSVIAVKRLDKKVKQNEGEFNAEVNAIGRTNHRNLVQLLGFCNEGEHRLLVYEFMSKGSLASFLFDTKRPSWNQRMKIALGTARGLLYLHEECCTQIIHCDIKPQNILLDENYTARISDFGLAKLLKTDQSGTDTAIRGTKGYVAPEWFRLNVPITAKADVYSYGVLLLELICCRRSFEMNAENENQMILTDWAYDCLREKNLGVLVEDDEEALDDMKNVEKYVMIAMWCIQEDPLLRPTMKKVLLMLEGSVDVPMPPNPSFF